MKQSLMLQVSPLPEDHILGMESVLENGLSTYSMRLFPSPCVIKYDNKISANTFN